MNIKPHHCTNLQLYIRQGSLHCNWVTKAHHKYFVCSAQLLDRYAVHLLLHIAFIVDMWNVKNKRVMIITFNIC